MGAKLVNKKRLTPSTRKEINTFAMLLEYEKNL